MAKITDYIQRIFPRRFSVLLSGWQSGLFGGFGFEHRDFASLIWYNICDIIADILEDVELKAPEAASAEGRVLFSQFRAFVYMWGRAVLQMLWDNGYVVIGYKSELGRFWIMSATEYTTNNTGDYVNVVPSDQTVQVYVMRSVSYITHRMSDRVMCKSWLDFLDDICNSSATVNKRLGALVVASPKNPTNATTAAVLTKEAKENLEKEIREDYGALASQSNIMILPREFDWTTINFAGMDLRTLEKAKLCILAICDRLKAPANQVAIVDANSSKTLSNGTELREGDRSKYATFCRLFERTFADMARDLGIAMTYTIKGEPAAEQQAQATTV